MKSILPRWWFQRFICLPVPGEMIQFDLPIFFKWVVQPPTSYKETSANCNVFEIMYTALLQCSSATVFLVPFHWVSPLSRYVSPNLPGGEVSHPVHHACIGAGGPLRQRLGHASVGCGPPPRMRTHFFKESFRKLPAPGIPGNPLRSFSERKRKMP